ncbi:MAG: hypothetical protein O2816_13770 [Planctomycetota bacterium]|nr:hypothetical protein [Planctomycetota bacterium]
MLHTAISALTLALATSAPTGTVHTVEKNGSGDFTSVQAAVDAAADGDIILVGGGSYSAPKIVNRELALVAREDNTVGLSHITEIRDLDQGKTVLVSGFHHNGITTSAPLQISGCKGPVRIDAATASGDDPGFCTGGNGIRVTNSKDVAIMRSSAEGGRSGADFGCDARGGHGMTVRNSQVAAWRSFFEGGVGSDAVLPDFPSDGGAGVILKNGSTFYSLYNLCQGGYGGTGFGGTALCGTGGHGVFALTSVMHDQDSILIGGAGGTGDGGVVCDSGLPYAGDGQNDVSGLPRGLEGPRVVVAGETMTLRIGGNPGEKSSLAISQKTRVRFEPSLAGAWLVGQLDLPLVPLGEAQGGATFVDILAPQLLPGEEGRVIYLQLVNQDAHAGTIIVGSPISVLVLQPGI